MQYSNCRTALALQPCDLVMIRMHLVAPGIRFWDLEWLHRCKNLQRALIFSLPGPFQQHRNNGIFRHGTPGDDIDR